MNLRRLALALAGSLLCVSPGISAEPVYEFRFNESGGSLANNKGSEDGQAVLQDSLRNESPLFSKEGEGVSGQPGDRAFDNRAAAGMGETPGGCVVIANAGTAIEGARSFTLAGWFRTPPDQPLTNHAVLLNLGSDDKTGGIILRGWDPPDTALQLRINGERVLVSSMDAFPEAGEWVFFAVTCDLTRDGPNTYLYAGSVQAPLHELARGQAPMEPVEGSHRAGSLGAASSAGNVPFQGLMDNVRVFLSTEDGSGALSPDELETLRLRDVEAP